MAQIKIQTKDLTGEPVKEASVVFNLEGKGLIERTTDNLGNTSISGIEVGVLPVTITKKDFSTQSFVLKIIDIDQIISKEVVMLSTENKEKPKEVVEQTVNTVIADTTKAIVDSYVFIEPKNIDEAKQWYKELEKNIDAQKDVINTALKNGVHDVVQQQASNLTYTLGQQLTASIHWYVNERSKLKPLESIEDLGKWATYTSMVAGLFFIRQNLVEYLNKLLIKLGKGI